jgi:hypothetical protein
METLQVPEYLTLKPKTASHRNVLRIEVEADTNDGDYTYTTTDISITDLPNYAEAINLLQDGLAGWGEQDYRNDFHISADLREALNDLIPCGEYGAHDINVVRLEYIDEAGGIRNVTFDYEKYKELYPENLI